LPSVSGYSEDKIRLNNPGSFWLPQRFRPGPGCTGIFQFRQGGMGK